MPAVLEAIHELLAEVALEVMEDLVDENDDECDEDEDVESFDDVELNDEDEVMLEVVELNPDTLGKRLVLERVAEGVDSGAPDRDVVATAATVGTPDGHGYAGTDGTCKSLGNGGTEGTEGTARTETREGEAPAAVATDGARADGTVPTAGVAVCSPITWPAVSSVAMTSTLTVRTLAVTCAG